ncbi:MAG: EAL domain-containing protein [Saccharospirillum sp.]|nr:EAL domain-containing protein [Saccharospirillum sp.]
MYRAKHQGKHRYELFRPAMAMEATRLVTLEQELRTAIAENQFEVYLQPIVNQKNGGLLSAEALLRWHHPTQGKLAPAHFMAFLENSDMINEVGQFVLETVCRYLARCRSNKSFPDTLRISINVCARELYQQDFPEQVRAMLERYHLTGSCIELEITESVALQRITEAIATMDQLIALGLTFALDDFGTGYSSLSYLKQLPVQTVKIDKTFIRDVTQDYQDAAMVAFILAIAKTLNLKTVAEGIELQDQATWLSQYEHISLQGYLVGRPLPIPEFHDRWANP